MKGSNTIFSHLVEQSLILLNNLTIGEDMETNLTYIKEYYLIINMCSTYLIFNLVKLDDY
jgi:hypothetical protein